MTRREAVLAMLASAEGRPFSPVQIQKAMFLLDRNMTSLFDHGDTFSFTPYDYGPFDSDVYSEAETLKSTGEVVVALSPNGRWSTYAASDAGLHRGRELLDRAGEQTKRYIENVSAWVRSQSFTSLVKSIYDAYPEMRQNSIFQG